MAHAFRISTNFYPLLNGKHLKCSINISRFKSRKNFARELRSSLKEDRLISTERDFHKNILQRQNEAKRTIIVQLNKFNDAFECTEYLKSFGKISYIYHYVTKMNHPNMLLVQFKTKDEVGNLLNEVKYLDTAAYMSVPTTIMQYQADGLHNISRPTESKLNFRKYSHHFPTWVMIKSNLLYSKSVSEQMIVLCKTLRLSDIDIRLRFFTAYQLCLTLGKLFPTLSILPFGSSVSGFGQLGSDLDIVCTVTNRVSIAQQRTPRQLIYSSKPFCTIERIEQQDFLKSVALFLSKFVPGITNMQSILKARVPIIKFSNNLTSMHCDLSSNNLSGFYMSEVLFNYGNLDERVKPLVFTLRKWAYSHGVTSDVAGQKLTNFSLTLLIMFYLQQKNILPPMTKILVSSSQTGKSELSIGFKPIVRSFIDHTISDHCSLEELLYGFFEFYAIFDFSMCAICIRDGKTTSKPDLSPIYLVNPLDPLLNVSRNVSASELNMFIKQSIRAVNTYNDNKVNSIIDLIEPAYLKPNQNETAAELLNNAHVLECETEKDDDVDRSNKLQEIIK